MKEIEFKDAEFMTAREKELSYKDFIRFVKNGFQSGHFTKRLYDHLHLHCGFIAHYNKSGFYATYFEEPEDTARFINNFDRDRRNFNSYISQGDYADINTAICNFIDGVKSDIYEKCSSLERNRDIETARKLLRKHSVTIEDILK